MSNNEITFSEIQIQAIFGHEAAEDEDIDRLKEYYFKGSVFDQVITDLPLRILVGHKGIGKSALFQVAMYEEAKVGRLSIQIKPDDIADIADEGKSFLKQIRCWKNGINEIIAKKVLQSYGLLASGWRKKLNQHGGMVLDFLVDTFSPLYKADLSPSRKLFINDFLKNKKISVYIDDLDRGWQGRKEDIRHISALLNAIRDISTTNKGIYFRISLRSDVYYLVRTSDESTDKIEGSVIWLSWTNHEIFALLIKRIETFFGRQTDEQKLLQMNQRQLATYLHPIFEPRFTGSGHWENAPMHRVLLSLIRKRPRDLIKLCTLAARKARENKLSIINTSSLESIFPEYSQGRLQDTINEFRSELPDIERLLLNMKPSKKEKRAYEGYVYPTSKLLQKIENIRQSGEFKFATGKIASNKELAAFMYKINFLTARKQTPQGIDRKYFEENRYLSNEFADFGYDWEIHPAYRWALQPDNMRDIYRSLELNMG